MIGYSNSHFYLKKTHKEYLQMLIQIIEKRMNARIRKVHRHLLPGCKKCKKEEDLLNWLRKMHNDY